MDKNLSTSPNPSLDGSNSESLQDSRSLQDLESSLDSDAFKIAIEGQWTKNFWPAAE